MTNQFKEELENGCKKLNIILSDRQLFQFFRYYELLLETNKVMNLTAITEEKEVIEKHFVDSLLLVRVLDQINENSGNKEPIKERFSKGTCIDVGTGAGFPGIPLKILFPELSMVLLDSLNKRVGFLNEVISEIGLSGIRAVHGRAEDLGKNREYREQFDFCVSRAVANLSTLSEYCIPFVKTGGFFIPYKSGKSQEEISEAEGAVLHLGGKMEGTVFETLPNSEAERAFVLIKKVSATPKKYPRKAGTPSRDPIS